MAAGSSRRLSSCMPTWNFPELRQSSKFSPPLARREGMEISVRGGEGNGPVGLVEVSLLDKMMYSTGLIGRGWVR